MEKKKKRKFKPGKKTVLISVLILAATIIFVMPNWQNKTKVTGYAVYRENCTKGDDYFEELCRLSFKNISADCIRQMKNNSIYCRHTKPEPVTEDALEKMGCECIERNLRRCHLKGFKLSPDKKWCINKQENQYTYTLKVCSLYKCKNDFYIERTKV